MFEENKDLPIADTSRRSFFKQGTALLSIAALPKTVLNAATHKLDEKIANSFEQLPLKLEINGKWVETTIDPRTTLLDLLRENMGLTGSKKGCDHGQCGACTVHVDGYRVNACLTLAITVQGKKITTIEGLAKGEQLHPMQEAFIAFDGFQCGYCTPGQIMSAVACIKEGHANSNEEIRSYMSGNICRCGCYSNIVEAIASVKKGGQPI